MAFDRPIEADQVDDLGLMSSLIRPIVWLLGGSHDEEAEGEEKLKETEGNGRVEDAIMGGSSANYTEGAGKDGGGSGGHGGGSSADTNRVTASCHDVGDPSPPDLEASPSPADQSDGSDEEENKDGDLPNWPSVGFAETSTDDDASVSKKRSDADATTAAISPPSPRASPQGEDSSESNVVKCPSSPRMDDLVTAMEGARMNATNEKDGSPGPATSAVLSSQSNVTSASTSSLSASYSASTFSNHQHASQTLSVASSVGNGPMHPSSKSFTSGIIRDKKKMSWSDECGNRSLVEYFDDSSAASRSKHWSAMKRRTSWKASRTGSFDGDDRAARLPRRGEVRVIKSALKRSGSYSPPVTYFAGNALPPPSMSRSSTDTSSSSSSSAQEMKSFRSISVIASSDSGSRSNASDLSKESSDSMAGVTEKKLHAKDVQCVPSTLQVGSAHANGGLIIPRGGPADSRYYFPRGGPNDPRYQLILGTGVSNASEQPSAPSDEQGGKEKVDAKGDSKEAGGPSKETTLFSAGNSSPGHFLPRPGTGYVSPQYGFYVNITPPTPEMYAATHKGDKAARSAVQQQVGYHQFQSQNKYQAPSPIPEGRPFPQRFVGRSSVPRPSSKRASKEKDEQSAAEGQGSSLKPTFTKNKRGMGMILSADNHHGVWPTVPFG
ncbi:hypothetical protein ACHAXT_004552 [Thalassiosira profunda]